VRGILMALCTGLCTAYCNKREGLEKMQVEHREGQKKQGKQSNNNSCEVSNLKKMKRIEYIERSKAKGINVWWGCYWKCE
jgi:uncharacterized membrane protein (DUF106 family)